MSRIAARFAKLKQEGRKGLIPFAMSYDPDGSSSLDLLKALPGAGADLIEWGMPFSDPMADGPIIQQAGIRALDAGFSLGGMFEKIADFRKSDSETPLILMGYYNPVFAYGCARFAKEAKAAGVDGLILVDLPLEEDAELTPHLDQAGIDFIRLIAPTTPDERLARIAQQAQGFLYYVSITGITGTASAQSSDLESALARIRRHTALPIAAGFGIKMPEQAKEAARYADAVVVGSALVDKPDHAERIAFLKALRAAL